MRTCFTLLLAVLTLVGPLAAAGPQLVVRGARGEDAPLKIAEVAVEVTIAGDVAETTILVGFQNETRRQLEGDFLMPLPEDATVSTYALDVLGHMRQGVAVEKERARFAYESIKRRMVDPGFVEREAGNVYRTKIFPIMPSSVKRVQLGYVETLKSVNGKLRYNLPCQFEVPIADFSCKIRGTGGTKLDLRKSLDLPFTESPSGALAARARNQAIQGTLSLTVQPPKRPTLLIEPGDEEEDRFFYLTDHAPADTPLPPRRQPRTALLVWDASESRRLQPSELATLDAWFQQVRSIEVHLQILRNTVAEAGVFQVRDGNWTDLESALEGIYYDGATALERLALDSVPEDVVILCSDAVSPFGLPSVQPAKPLFILNGSGAPIPRPWSALAHRSGGSAFHLARVAPAQAARVMSHPGLRIVSIAGGGTHSCHFDPDVTPGQPVRISGRLGSDASGIFTVNYGVGTTVLATRAFTIDSGQPADGGIVRRLWAQAALKSFESVPSPSRDRIIAHCRKFGLVSDFTSLIVLERFEDHVRYEIPPPEERLRVRYDSAIASKKAKVTANRGFDFLTYRWSRKRTWHQREFPWMEIALLPRLEQVSIWTRAVSTVFRPEDIDQESFQVINDWRKAATKVVQRKTKLANGADLEAWQRDLETYIRSGGTLRQTPIRSPKQGEPLVVSVRGLVNQPGNVSAGPGLTLRQAIARAGGIFTLGSETNVELYRNAGKTVYNMASNQFQDVPLKPGDMIVVGQSNEPASGWGDADPFAADTDREPWDPTKEPAVIDDGDVWIQGAGNVDPFGDAGTSEGSPTFLTELTGNAGPSIELTGTIRVQPSGQDLPATFKKFEAALQKGTNPHDAYKALRRSGPQAPGFYANTARLLTTHGHHFLAVQVLSNFLETPEPDLGRILANTMWLAEFEHPEEAITLLASARKHMPDDVLASYHRALIGAGRDDGHSLAADLLHVITQGRQLQGTIALTDLNGLVARGIIPHPRTVPQNLRDNLDADIRLVVTGSNPDRQPGITVKEPTGTTCRYTSDCGGRIEHATGVSEYMMRRAMPGRYTLSCHSRAPMTVRAVLYRDWGRPNQTSKTVTLVLPGNLKNTTIAEYEFELGE